MTDDINDQDDKQDTTDEIGDSNLISDQEGHSTGEVGENPDIGGDNLGNISGMDDLTKVGDADSQAGPPIDEDTDGTQVGQGGHPGTDEGTD